MNRMFSVGLLLFLCAQQTSAQLPSRLKQTLDNELIPAYLESETLSVLKVGSKMIARMSDKNLDQVNNYLRGSGVPELGSILVDARLTLIQSNYQGSLTAPSARELELTIPAYQSEIDRSIATIESSEFMKSMNVSVKRFEEFEDLLWKAHVARNQLVNVGHLLKNAHDDAKRVKKSRRRRSRDTDKDQTPSSAETFVDLAVRMKALLQDVDERTIEIRIDRLAYAMQQLQNNDDKVQHFKASWAIETDSGLLNEWLQSVKDDTVFQRDRLNRAGTTESVKEQIARSRELAGEDLLAKSRLFYTGLHWWFRGRYGAGPEGYGFLKRATALNSASEMFGLYMPQERPVPTTPYDSNYQIPEVDRRHHYLWMFEYRRLYKERSRTVSRSRSRKDTSRTTLSRFY